MASRDPILPNAGIIARREYRDRTRSPLFIVSTVVLALLAMPAALAPIVVRSVDRTMVTRIAIVSSDADLATRAVAVTDSVLNVPPAGSTDPDYKRPYVVEVATDAEAAERRLAAGSVGGILHVERLASGQIDVALRTFESPNSARSQVLSVAAFGIGVIDWSSRLPPSDARAQFLTPTYRVDTINTAIEGDKPIDAQQAADGFLGIVFVVLLFITIIIYGMWVATGVASEKSSRVMELMISAASPRQTYSGKVVGDGVAGLTQYLAIAVPAVILLVFQDRIAEAIRVGPMGERHAAGRADAGPARPTTASSSCSGSPCSP